MKITTRKLITFLGKGRYESTFYLYPGSENQNKPLGPTRFAFLAIAKEWGANEVKVLATSGAYEEHKKNVEVEASSLAVESEIEFVAIPAAGHPPELWDVFEKIGETLRGGGEVAVDITHGFRSLPLVGLAALAYFKHLRGLNIAHIWYAAFEARGENGCPLIDLKIFLEVMDLMWAVRQWRERGELHPLAEVLRQAQGSLYAKHQQDSALVSLSEKLKEVGNALRLVQPHFVSQYAREALHVLKKAEEVGLYKELPSVKSLWDELRKEIDSLSQPPNKWKEYLNQMLDLIKRYVGWEAYLPAVLLAREWLVTAWIAREQGADDALDEKKPEVREEAAQELQTLLSKKRNGTTLSPAEEIFAQAWGAVHKLRNTLAHCGIGRKESLPSIKEGMNKIMSNLQGVHQQLQELWHRRMLSRGSAQS